MTRPLPIALTFDLDPDVFDASIDPESHRNRLTWLCITLGIRRIHEALEGIPAFRGIAPPCTWFVRVDNQIADIYGRPAHLLEQYDAIFRDAQKRGDEISWHPHLYRRIENNWIQETDDAALNEALKFSVTDMRKMGYEVACSRIGEAYGSSGIMRSLSQLGIRYDTTAMAGRRRVDDQRLIDWLPTPPDGYRPSQADHRVPGKPEYPILEVPMSMLQVKAEYDEQPILRYLDLSFHPVSLDAGLAELVKNAPYLVAVTHPSAILAECRPAKPHGLLSYAIEGLVANVLTIISYAEMAGRGVQFVTMSDLGRQIETRIDG